MDSGDLCSKETTARLKGEAAGVRHGGGGGVQPVAPLLHTTALQSGLQNIPGPGHSFRLRLTVVVHLGEHLLLNLNLHVFLDSEGSHTGTKLERIEQIAKCESSDLSYEDYDDKEPVGLQQKLVLIPSSTASKQRYQEDHYT